MFWLINENRLWWQFFLVSIILLECLFISPISSPLGGMHLWVLNVGCTNLKTSKLLLTFVSSELNLINGAKEDILVI